MSNFAIRSKELLLRRSQSFTRKLGDISVSTERQILKMAANLKSQTLNFHELGVLLIIGAISNIYFLTTFSLSIDDE
jgi:hypothetical protein